MNLAVYLDGDLIVIVTGYRSIPELVEDIVKSHEKDFDGRLGAEFFVKDSFYIEQIGIQPKWTSKLKSI